MKKIIVFGLGISGISTVRFLLQNGYKVLAGDDNESSINNLKKEISKYSELEKNLIIFNSGNEIDWSDAPYLVLAPGIPLNYPKPHNIVLSARKNNCKIICDIELFYLFNSFDTFLGITGTNGKSTTTALTGHIFKENNINSAIGGNIGLACFDMPKLKNSANYIFETSSYQLDLMDQTHFHIAVLLNITPDHIDRHLDMEGYIRAKKRIFMNQKEGDFAIIGIDNLNSKKVYEQLKNDINFKAKLIPISTKIILENGVSVIDGKIYNHIEKKSEIDLGELKFLRGEHNAQNIAAAYANCFLSKIPEDNIVKSIKSFKGLSHRMQLIGHIGDINFINDSKATNAESTENALKAFKNIYWILGGKPKEGGIKNLLNYFSKIKYAFLIGEATEEFAKTLDEHNVKYFKCGDLKNAVATAYDKALKDNGNEKNILLSPACASFDQWKNFEERGNYFCDLYKNYSELKI